MREIPAVSVVIPLYNAAKYIGECLDSLLAQTFQKFEVIVVDDCSTDDSFALVEGYRERFGGRLTLTKTKQNSGGGGEPRNRGLRLSRGEYLFFMDADDAFTRTALEEMYSLAKKFDADTVYCERYYMSSGSGKDFIAKVHIADNRTQNFPVVDEPKLDTNDMAKRVNRAVIYGYWVTPWLRLVSRNLLIDNDITFPSLIGSNDVGWTFKVLFCSKRFLRIPNACYIWRTHEKSNTFRERATPQFVHKWLDRTIRSLKDMDNFMSGIPFLRDNPAYRYAVCDCFLQKDFKAIFNKCAAETPFSVYSIIRKEFGSYLGEHDVLVAALCSALNTQQKISAVERQQFNRFAAAAVKQDAQFKQFFARAREQEKQFRQILTVAQRRIGELEAEVRRLKNSGSQ